MVEVGAPLWLAKRRRGGRRRPRVLEQMMTVVAGRQPGNVALPAVAARTVVPGAAEIVAATVVVGKAAEVVMISHQGGHPPGGRTEYCALLGENIRLRLNALDSKSCRRHASYVICTLSSRYSHSGGN